MSEVRCWQLSASHGIDGAVYRISAEEMAAAAVD